MQRALRQFVLIRNFGRFGFRTEGAFRHQQRRMAEMYPGDQTNYRYSPLDQINAGELQ